MHRVLDLRRDVNAVKVDDATSSPLISIDSKKDLESAVRLMNSNGISRLAVLREGTLVGILTMTDLMLKFPRGYFSHEMVLKRFLVDTLAYITFWSGIWTLIQLYVLKFTLIQYVENAMLSVVLTVIFGGLYGRYLDIWRRKMAV
jgi:signal-transduction protein with cAMP-binding, CBS, and nucleotidyltransferase domain